MTLELTYPQVINGWTDAWDSLPIPYQNDNSLEFYVGEGILFSRPTPNAGLGSWEAYWDLHSLLWVDGATNEPIT